MIISLRKRPKSTSSKAKSARKPFGLESTKKLPIQEFNNSYNHNMNHVDQADQLRCYSMNLRHTYKGWKALFQFIFNVVLVNYYLLSFHSDTTTRYTDHIRFHTVLIDALINASKPPPFQQSQKRQREIHMISPTEAHIRVRRPRVNECVECRRVKKEEDERKGVKRLVLQPVDCNKRHIV